MCQNRYGWKQVWLLGLLAGILLSACQPFSDPGGGNQAPSSSDQSIDKQAIPATLDDTASALIGHKAVENPSEVASDGSPTATTATGWVANEETSTQLCPMEPDSWQRLPRVRWILLNDAGPLLVDWLVIMDGHFYQAIHDELYAKAWELVSSVDKVSWPEITVASLFALYDRRASDLDVPLEPLMRRFDANQDKTVQESELLDYLRTHPNWGRVFQPFSELRPPSADSRINLWRLADADGNGELDRNELARLTSSVLAEWDIDGNGLLDEQDTFDSMPFPVSADELLSEMETDAISLDAVVIDWNRVLYRMEDRYGLGQPLRPNSWHDQELFAELDDNRDSTIDEREVRALQQVRPHVVIELRWEASKNESPMSGESQQPGSTLHVVLRAQARQVTATLHQVGPTQWRLLCGGRELHIQSLNQAALWRSAEDWFGLADRDKNDYLDATEFELVFTDAVPLRWADQNTNGRVEPDEFQRLWEKVEELNGYRILADVQTVEDRLTAAVDQNQDGRITQRELAAAQKVAQWDQDHDGLLLPEELPSVTHLILARGSGPVLTRQVMPPAEQSVPAPEWFTAMDGNRDGDVSIGEFLGPLNLFDKLDRDQDRLLSVEEAQAASYLYSRESKP